MQQAGNAINVWRFNMCDPWCREQVLIYKHKCKAIREVPNRLLVTWASWVVKIVSWTEGPTFKHHHHHDNDKEYVIIILRASCRLSSLYYFKLQDELYTVRYSSLNYKIALYRDTHKVAYWWQNKVLHKTIEITLHFTWNRFRHIYPKSMHVLCIIILYSIYNTVKYKSIKVIFTQF